MSALNRGLLTAGGAAVLLVGAWIEGGPRGQAHATVQPALVHQRDYSAFRLREADRNARLSPDYQSCMDSAQGTGDMRQCATTEQQRLTGIMNAAFRNAVGRLSRPTARDRLRADQNRWQQGRQAHCEGELAQSGEEGGSMGLLVLDSCALHELVRRTMWLEQHR